MNGSIINSNKIHTVQNNAYMTITNIISKQYNITEETYSSAFMLFCDNENRVSKTFAAYILANHKINEKAVIYGFETIGKKKSMKIILCKKYPEISTAKYGVKDLFALD